MTEILTHPTWNQLDQGAKKLVGMIQDHGYCQPHFIVGLTRGGLIPAVTISHVMDIPMIAVNYSSVHGRGDNRNHQNSLPAIVGEPVTSGLGKLPELPTLLIVDDICDSGKTMAEVNQYYKYQGHRVWTCSLYYKDGSIHRPDFFWQHIPENSPWIIFPFEVE